MWCKVGNIGGHSNRLELSNPNNTKRTSNSPILVMCPFWGIPEKLRGWKKLFSGRLISKSHKKVLIGKCHRIRILHVATIRTTPNDRSFTCILALLCAFLCLTKTLVLILSSLMTGAWLTQHLSGDAQGFTSYHSDEIDDLMLCGHFWQFLHNHKCRLLFCKIGLSMMFDTPTAPLQVVIPRAWLTLPITNNMTHNNSKQINQLLLLFI